MNSFSRAALRILSILPSKAQVAGLQRSIQAWINEGGISRDQRLQRRSAANKIVEAYRDGKRELDLDYKQLTSLPPEIGALHQLQKLDLDRNRLTSLPAEIGALRQLRELRLYGNRLTSLPAEIGALRQLRKLDLGYNQLTSLPTEIWDLHQLQKLDLDRG